MEQFAIISLLVFLCCVTAQNSILLKLVETDKILNGNPVKVVKVYSIIECNQICLQHQHCTSVNIIIGDNPKNAFECQILNVGKWTTEIVFTYKRNAYHYQLVQRNGIAQMFPKQDCLEWKRHGYDESGVYQIEVNGKLIKLFCDMETDGGGWIAFQNRFDGSVLFDRTWKEFKDGFGNVEGEFWLGNEIIHILSNRKVNVELWYEGTSFSNEKKHVKSKNFKMISEIEKYSIMWTGKWTQFSTKDQDNDNNSELSCVTFYGPWWHDNCFSINLNGRYPKEESVDQATGIAWIPWIGDLKSLKASKMMIR